MIKECCWENGRGATREVSAPCSGGAVWKSCVAGTHNAVSLSATDSAGCLPRWPAQVGWSHDLAGGQARCPLLLRSSFHLLPVSRALGIPCRVVTNYASAHDSNGNLVIERYIDENGDLVQSKEMIWYEAQCQRSVLWVGGAVRVRDKGTSAAQLN